tara:strand:- start:55 stop:1953 length:1899 start_codon:yes stop_codon:yes gene_type:complete
MAMGIELGQDPNKEEKVKRLWDRIDEPVATSYEIGAGLTFDAITAPLGLAPPVYAALNFGEAYFNNVVAQKIRGRKWNEIDWNEALVSGGLGLVPFSQLRAAKYIKKPVVAETIEKVVGEAGTLQRNIIGGGITGGADVTARSLLEGELPDPTELATGIGGGAALGGTLTPILRKTSKYVNEIVIKKKVNKAEGELLSKQLEIQEKIKNDPNSLTTEDTQALRKAIWNVDKARGDYGPFDSFEDWKDTSDDFANHLSNKITNPTSTAQRYAINRKAAFKRFRIVNRTGAEEIIQKLQEQGRKKKGVKSRTIKAQIINDLSDRSNWNEQGNRRIEAWINKLTPREQELAGMWHKHHKRPLAQHNWTVSGLSSNEIFKAQQYSYKRMSAGGDVLNNQRITMDRPHTKAHVFINQQLGDMRSKGGKSIEGVLDPFTKFDKNGNGIPSTDPKVIDTIEKYLALDTFKKRKPYISRFFDTVNKADDQIQNVMDAVDIARRDAPTLSIDEVASTFNKIDDPSDISILDDFLKEIEQTLDPDNINKLAGINEEINELVWKYNQLLDQIPLDPKAPFTKSQSKALTKLENQIDDATRRKAEIVPIQLDEYVENKLMNMMRKRRGTNIPPVDSIWNLGQDN